jgi:hypothetical protein
MRLISLAALLAGSLARAECHEQVVSAATSPGPLAFTRYDGQLVLVYRGPMEPDIGRHWPMQASLRGRTLKVTLAPASVPDAPGGATFDALGSNPGSVVLPRLEGRYHLVVRQARAVAEFELEVADDVTVTAAKAPPEALRFSPERWRATPENAAIVRCAPRPGCPAERCDAFFETEPVRAAPHLEAGAYLELSGAANACVVTLPPGQENALLQGVPDGGCYDVSVQRFPVGPSPGAQAGQRLPAGQREPVGR